MKTTFPHVNKDELTRLQLAAQEGAVLLDLLAMLCHPGLSEDELLRDPMPARDQKILKEVRQCLPKNTGEDIRRNYPLPLRTHDSSETVGLEQLVIGTADEDGISTEKVYLGSVFHPVHGEKMLAQAFGTASNDLFSSTFFGNWAYNQMKRFDARDGCGDPKCPD